MTLPHTFWQNRAADKWPQYWDTLHAPYRDVLIAELRKLQPFRTLLEIGCGPGVNLWRILEAFPDVTVGGFDVSPEAIHNGHARFQEAERCGTLKGTGDVWLAVGALPDSLEHVQPVDVVLSCYALAYVSPAQFGPTMAGLLQVAQQALVLAEPMVVVGDHHGLSHQIHTIRDADGRVIQGEFKHDYLTFFTRCAPEWQVTTMKPLVVDRMNRVLIAQRKR